MKGIIKALVRAHPRMRGEHNIQDIQPGDLIGSSPHARGALGLILRDAPVLGLIPACAGSTRCCW